MSVRVSLIISVFEQIEYTKRCLSSLERTLNGKVEYEVLIVDDASEDGSAEFLRSLKVPFQVFFNSERKGFAKNNNLAASKAKGEFLCLLNNDVFVKGDWLLPMIKVFEEKEDAGVIGNVQRLAESRKYDHMGVVLDRKVIQGIMGNGLSKEIFAAKSKDGVQSLRLVVW